MSNNFIYKQKKEEKRKNFYKKRLQVEKKGVILSNIS